MIANKSKPKNAIAALIKVVRWRRSPPKWLARSGLDTDLTYMNQGTDHSSRRQIVKCRLRLRRMFDSHCISSCTKRLVNKCKKTGPVREHRDVPLWHKIFG